jgi:hypothetical protein
VHCLGVADVLTVLDAERTLLSAQDQLADRDTRTATALVAVYKALGGGWDIAPERADSRAPLVLSVCALPLHGCLVALTAWPAAMGALLTGQNA